MDIRFRLMNQKDSSKEFFVLFYSSLEFHYQFMVRFLLLLLVASAGYNFLQFNFFIVINNN